MHELRAINIETGNDLGIRKIKDGDVIRTVGFDNFSDRSSFYYAVKVCESI